VPVRARRDGWTPERQAGFIRALAESGCVVEACARVGMSDSSAYRLVARSDAVSFRLAWDAAMDFATRRLSSAAFSRALNGVSVPVFYQGEVVGERRYYDERLTMFLLRYRDPLRYGKWRDRASPSGHHEIYSARLTKGIRDTLSDAGVSPDEIPERYRQRIREIARELRIERGEEEEDEDDRRDEDGGEDEGDVA
jgi:hypothetical protein